ncbi:MAG: tyrosine-protein phosphatase [Pseudomonadales bacterium]
MQNQHVPLEGTPNFRDLGGYSSRCGRRVAEGRLFRSGTLAYLSPSDWQQLAERNIALICDFRREDERRLEPTLVPDQLDIRVLEIPVGAGSHTGFLQRVLGQESENQQAAFDLMTDINRAFVLEHRAPFIRLLESALELEDDQALLFHCTAGKDRTGFGAAMLLSCLDVERDTILQDYLLTKKYFVPEREIQNIRERFGQDDWLHTINERLLPVLDTQPEYLSAAFNAIDSQWGDTENFLLQAMGVDDAMRAQLRNRFLR